MGKYKRNAPTRASNAAKLPKTDDNAEGSPFQTSPTKSVAENTITALNQSGTEAVEKSADLNYDEYDLSEECDMVVRCKSCDTVFLSLEKFISHKKNKCKVQSAAAKPSVSNTANSDATVTELLAQIPVMSPTAEQIEERVVTDERRKDDITLAPAEMLSKPVTKFYSSRRSKSLGGSQSTPIAQSRSRPMLTGPDFGEDLWSENAAAVSHSDAFIVCSPPPTSTEDIDITDRIKAPTLPDEVVRISDLSTHEQLRSSRMLNVGSKPKSTDLADQEVDYNIDDIVNIRVQYEEESDPELPVDVKVIENPKQRIVAPAPKPVASVSGELTPYQLVDVVENTSKVVSQPRLGLTFEQLKNVKTLNLMAPLPSPPVDVHTLMADGTIVGPKQTVLAASKDDVSLKLLLRRVVHPTAVHKPSDIAKSSEPEQGSTAGELNKEQTEMNKQPELLAGGNDTSHKGEVVLTTDRQADSAGFNIWETDVSGGEVSSNPRHMDTSSQGIISFDELEKTESDVKQGLEDEEEELDESMEFEHDPDLYDYLRDDDYYTLGPRQRGRLACVDIKTRTDCDWQTRRCFRCNTLYSCVKTLTNHMSYQHADKKVFYPCIYCRNIYSQQKNLSRHLNKTHGKSEDYVAKMRAFVRNQAFVRQLKALDYNSEKLTEENDPFLRNMRRRIPPSTPTRYCSVPDREMLSKFGRKLRMIGRPPGRPTKNKSSNMLMTCTLCQASINTSREMLRHLKDVHSFSQKSITKLRPKLSSKVQEVAVAERVKAVEREKELLASRAASMETKFASDPSGNLVIKGFNIDRFGRLVMNKPEATQVQNQTVTVSTKSISTPINIAPHRTTVDTHRIVKPLASESQSTSASATVTSPYSTKERTHLMSLTACPTCQKIFVNQSALDKHTPSCLPTVTVAQSAPPTQVYHINVPQTSSSQPQVQQLIVDQGTIRPAMSHMVVEQPTGTQQTTELIEDPADFSTLATEGEIVEDNELYFKVIKTPTSYTENTGIMEGTSGLDTLAMISTSEANKAESPQGHTMPTEHTTEIHVQTDSAGGHVDPMQTLTITEDQLEQLKASGGNIIYLMKTPSGGMERIEAPQGMEVVEISQLADGQNIYNVS